MRRPSPVGVQTTTTILPASKPTVMYRSSGYPNRSSGKVKTLEDHGGIRKIDPPVPQCRSPFRRIEGDPHRIM
jgi:hypothetical protein